MATTSRFLFTIITTLLLGIVAAHAQAAQPTLGPNDTVQIGVVFSGPNANTIKEVYVQLSLSSAIHSDQVGFKTSVDGSWISSQTSTGTYMATLTIPDTIASGEYVVYIEARGPNTPATLAYRSGVDFQFHSYHIENSKTYAKPRITVTEPQH